MKTFFSFIKSTLLGGILFLLPSVLLIIILTKAYSILEKLSEPLSERLPESASGFNYGILLTIVLLLTICFFSGLLIRSAWVNKRISKLENTVLVNIPGYSLIKSITADAVRAKSDKHLLPITIRDGDSWNIGFLVEVGDKVSMVFIPDAPKYDAGEMRVVASENVQKLNISTKDFLKSIKIFGKGIIHHMD
ncbi:Uncharacterized membrane protein [Muriicola jejuensis]|uniref:DUF502 domain-containing protein n=1 Tax=Muriicola jejuensis TaxID=504488 RepID=A0A6P0UBB1_9FLAO|nr:hypothetical protein [Muriicola jejuensis]NER08918.1 hypothetical protein [Muriicola jejuensis]SMP12895.1 Uncharacterized membrane protein [Muriicola jejuensis]